MALAMVTALAAVVAAVGVWSGRPQIEPVGALPTVLAPPPEGGAGPSGGPWTASAGAAPTGPPTPAVLVISVSGKVARPGLVEVTDGARVAEVLDAAGGALPGTDLTALNLARRVVDGEQVAVGVPPAPDAVPTPGGTGPGGGSGAGTAGGTGASGPVDLNSATQEQLDALPGVGPVTAERILQWRATYGRFARVDQLREVEGIGEQRFARLRELVRV